MKPLLILPNTIDTKRAEVYENGYHMPTSPHKCTIFGEHCTYNNLNHFLEVARTINPTLKDLVEEYLFSLIEESLLED
jgi:hypothetical protein